MKQGKGIRLLASSHLFANKMKILNYVKSLLPVVGKSGMLEDLRSSRAQLTELQNLLTEQGKLIDIKFKDSQNVKLQSTYNSMVGSTGGKNMFVNIGTRIPDALKTIDLLEAMVSGAFEENIATKGLSFKNAQLMQLTDATMYVSRFIGKLLTYSIKLENAAVRESKKLDQEAAPEVLPAELQYITEGFVPFCVAWAALTKPATSLTEQLESIPDALATDASFSMLRNTVGEDKVDPFLFQTSNFRFSPIRAIRMRRAEAKHARFVEAQNENQMNRLRLAQLQRLNEGKEDPVLEREIRYLESVTQAQARELEELES